MGSGLAGELSSVRQDRAAGRALALAALVRGAWFLATLVGAVFLVQLLLWVAPGDPIDLLPNGEELRPALEREWGLDKPLVVAFTDAIWRSLQGDLGTSLTVRPGAAVRGLVSDAGLRSSALLFPSLILGLALGTAVAFVGAGRRRGFRRLVQILSVPPTFLIAYLAVLGLNEGAFALIQAGHINRPDWFALPDQPSLLRAALAVTILAIGSASLSEISAAAGEEIDRLRKSGFIEAAVARGEPTWPHILWNIVPVVATVATDRVAFLVGEIVVIEKVLMFNGAGALLWEACLRRDYPLAIGLGLAAALAVCSARFLGDLVRVWIDPRLREAS